MKNNDISRAIAEQHRGRLLVALRDKGSKNTLHVLDDVEWNRTDMESLRIELYHIHLPMLNDKDLIDWNRNSYIIGKGNKFENIQTDLPTNHGKVLTVDD